MMMMMKQDVCAGALFEVKGPWGLRPLTRWDCAGGRAGVVLALFGLASLLASLVVALAATLAGFRHAASAPAAASRLRALSWLGSGQPLSSLELSDTQVYEP